MVTIALRPSDVAGAVRVTTDGSVEKAGSGRYGIAGVVKSIWRSRVIGAVMGPPTPLVDAGTFTFPETPPLPLGDGAVALMSAPVAAETKYCSATPSQLILPVLTS